MYATYSKLTLGIKLIIKTYISVNNPQEKKKKYLRFKTV